MRDGAECIEIQISHSDNAARYVSTIVFTVRDQRSQEAVGKRYATAREMAIHLALSGEEIYTTIMTQKNNRRIIWTKQYLVGS